LKASLERMAEAAEAAGVIDEERYALTQLTRLAPEHTAYTDRLQELGGATEEAAAEVLPNLNRRPKGRLRQRRSLWPTTSRLNLNRRLP